jgi:hypothetical protein
LELTGETASRKERYKKIVVDHGAVDRLLVDIFLEAHREAPEEIILDLDATDDPLHGQQEGRFFHGYYGHYCYLPLYIFCGEFLLCARLRSSNIDASAGSVEELQRIVAQIRSAWPQVRLVVRGDSGFVENLLGLAKNERLQAEIAQEMGEAKAQYQQTGRAARLFKEFFYQTRKSWSRARRVVAKAEHLEKGENQPQKEKTLTQSEKRISYTTAPRETISQLPTYTSFIALLPSCERCRLILRMISDVTCNGLRREFVTAGTQMRFIDINRLSCRIEQAPEKNKIPITDGMALRLPVHRGDR